MARPLPVNLLMAGTGAVLLVSGIGGESLGEVLKGNFGNLNPKGQQVSNMEGAGATTQDVAFGTEQGIATGSENPVASASSSPFGSAPSPTTFRHVTKEQEAKAIAGILLARGIRNPTHQQIEEARAFYHKK